MKKKAISSFRLNFPVFRKRWMITFSFLTCSIISFGQTTFSGTGNWSNPARWNAGVPGAGTAVTIASGAVCTVDGTGATCGSLTFAANAVNSTVTITNNLAVVGAITYSNPSVNNISQTIAVGTATLSCGSITMVNTNNTRVNNLTVSSGTITVINNITCSGSAAAENTIIFSGPGHLNIGGNFTVTTITFTPNTSIVNYNGGGAQSVFGTTYNNLSLSNAGTKTISGATTVNANLTIRAGVTLALGANNLGTPTSLTMECGAPIGSSITGTGIVTLGGNVTVNDVTTGIDDANISTPVALGATRTFTVADDGTSATDLTVSGIISGGFGVIKDGYGTINLSGLNTFTGLTTISSGTLRLGVGSNLAASGPLGTNAGGVTVSSGAVLDLNGFTIGATNGEALTINGTGLTASPAGALTNTGVAASYLGTISLGSASTVTATTSGTLIVSAVTSSTNALTLDGAGTGTVSGVIGASSGTLTKNGNGIWTLSGANTYTGGTILNSGTLNINNANALGTVAGTFTITGGTINNTSGGPITTLSYPQAWGGDFIFTGTNALNLGTGAVTINSNRQVTVSASTLTVGGIISGATYNLTKAGGGTLTMGANSVTLNGLTISAGTLTAPSATMNLSGDFSNSGTFTHNSGTVNINGSSPQSIGGSVAATFNNFTLSGSGGVTLGLNATVNGILAMNQGNITTGAFTLAISNGLASSLAYSSGIIIGKIKRAVSTTLSTNYLFPVGTAGFYRPAVLNFSSLSATTDITAEFIATAPSGFAGYSDGGTPLNNTFTEGYWRFSSSGSPTGTYSLTLTGNGFTSFSLNEVTRITGRDNSNGTWRALGIHGSQSGNDVSRTGVTNLNSTFFDIAIANGCGNISMGYGYERNVTIDYTKVSGGADLYSFPMLVKLSGQTFLRTSPTGHISNSNGYDIIFTDINYNKLDHQLEYYNGTNGDLIAWVRIPILSCSANTVIKIMYGNSQVTTDLSVASVWDSHYKGVWHLNNNSLNDFTSYNKSGTAYNTPAYPAGQISNSLGLNGTAQYVEVLNDPNINFAGNITISAWIRMTTGGRDQKIASNQNNSSGGYKFGVFTNDKVEFEIRNSSNAASLNRDVTGGTVLTTGQWYYVAGMSSDVLDSIKTFVNGIPERPFKKTGILGIASNNLVLSKEPFDPQYYFAGQFDEIRISDKVRSNGWLRTEYNNQVSPSSFCTVSSESISYEVLSSSICNSPITLTFGYPSGGTYSGNTYLSGNIFTPPSAGTYPITYTYNGGCGSSSITKNIIITPVPSAPDASNKVYCTGQIAYLEATTGTNIKWYSGSTMVSTANPYSTGITAPGTYNYTVTQTVNGCVSPAASVTLTILTVSTIITQPQPTTACTASNATFSVLASGYNMVYQWQEGGVDIVNGGIYSGATTATLTLSNPGIAKNGASYRCRIFSSCGASPITSNAAILTVKVSPVATFSYTGTPYCPNAVNPSPAFSGGGVAGTFSSTAGLVFISTATGQVNLSASTPGSYTITNTIPAAGGCGLVTATSPISIISNLTWSGAVSSDWNTPGNWSCGLVPTLTTNVQILNVANKPVLNSGAAATVNNITVDLGSSLTIDGVTLVVAGTITNNGTLTATNGSVVMNGSVAQVIATGTFSGNKVKDLTINNTSGVTLSGPLNVTGTVLVTAGNLVSGGNLTLVSDAAGTALISGTGSGNVTGDVTMQRYLADGFGYKYFSSPMQGAKIAQLGDDMMALTSTNLYKYVEDRPASGWVSYSNTDSLIRTLRGYAVNFGNLHDPRTVDITAPVNNGNLAMTIKNNNRLVTKGLHLVGNPYPSPIDWDIVVAGSTNIDLAAYFFKASGTAQYGGTYASYVDGVSTGGSSLDIIQSMQGFFVHVSDGTTGILRMTNAARTVNFSQPFVAKKGASKTISAKGSSPAQLKLSLRYSDDMVYEDPMVLYIDEKGTPDFEGEIDALKLLNTDLQMPNIYSVASDGTIMSINALSPITEDFIKLPLGIKLNRSAGGTVIFKLQEIDTSLAGMRVSLSDIISGVEQDLLSTREYTITLPKGEYLNRFYLNFSNTITSKQDIETGQDIFKAYSSDGILKAEVNTMFGNEGLITVFNFTGQKLFSQKIYVTGYHEFNTILKEGVYIASYRSGSYYVARKLFIERR